MKYKIGDEVVLRPETKPYTFKDFAGEPIKKYVIIHDDKIYKVMSVHGNGDVTIYCDGSSASNISIHHIKHAKENTTIGTLSVDLDPNELLKDIDIVELRLSIFNGDTSRTLEEMKAIESWLLGEFK